MGDLLESEGGIGESTYDMAKVRATNRARARARGRARAWLGCGAGGGGRGKGGGGYCAAGILY